MYLYIEYKQQWVLIAPRRLLGGAVIEKSTVKTVFTARFPRQCDTVGSTFSAQSSLLFSLGFVEIKEQWQQYGAFYVWFLFFFFFFVLFSMISGRTPAQGWSRTTGHETLRRYVTATVRANFKRDFYYSSETEIKNGKKNVIIKLVYLINVG